MGAAERKGHGNMTKQEKHFLEIADLRKSFGQGEARQDVLRGVNFTVEKGEVCVLLGPSGSGKSTLLNIIGAIDKPGGGYVAIGGDKLQDMDEKHLTQYRRLHLGYVFQMYNLIPNLNVKENIEVGAYLSARPLDVEEVLTTLGLQEHKYKYPNQLSGGQQQRVSIGRALMNAPAVVLADEPTGNLDSKNSQEIVELLKFSNRKYGQTLIVITHDESIALQADRVIAIEDGRIVRDERIRGAKA